MRAKKALGQHFLKSTKILERIIAAGELAVRDVVLEVGPGTGVLTDALLRSGARVVAVEKDKELIEHLRDRFAHAIQERQLMLLQGDILAFDPRGHGLPEHAYKLVANIPYYITGEILRRFLSEVAQPSRMVLLVQKEVADRIVATDGKESILSLSVKLFGTPSIVARVPKSSFSPAPRVDSAVLAINAINHSGLAKKDAVRFFQLVHAGFSQKRKQLVPLLTPHVDKRRLLGVLAKHGLPATARAERLPLAAWLELAKT